MTDDEMTDDPVEAAVREAAYRLRRRAARWSVDVPDEWYVTADDGESFIGGLFHERVEDKIRHAKLTYLSNAIGLVGGILGIAAFVRGC